jgi:hypothetical protein
MTGPSVSLGGSEGVGRRRLKALLLLQEPYEKGDDAKELHRAGPETSIRDIMAGAGDGAAL